VGTGNLAAAMILQHALAQAWITEVDDAAEALDLFTVRLGEPADLEPDDLDPDVGPPGPALAPSSTLMSPFQAAFCCGEFSRTGDTELLDQAARIVLLTSTPTAGLGVAATQLCLALVLSGADVQPVLGHLAEVSRRRVVLQPGTPGSVARLTAELELIAVTSASEPSRGGPIGDPDLLARVDSLGRRLGSGLKGRPVRPLPVVELAHLTTVLQLLPDGTGEVLTGAWGCSPRVLAARAVPEVVARLEGQPAGLAHVWLMLGQQPH